MTNNVSEVVRFLAEVGTLYRGRFLEPLWDRYPNRENNDLEAVTMFLEGYAFARQGAPAGFVHAACDTMEQLRDIWSPDYSALAHEAWKRFSRLLENTDLNYANNPLCPKGTQYIRTYKRESRGAKTYGLSVLEFLDALARGGRPANLISFAKTALEEGKLGKVHRELCAINGVGFKIASLFLRDVATFYEVFPLTHRYLLQPIDVWVRRISATLKRGDLASDQQIAQCVVTEAARTDVSPEIVNQGMWYLGSQVAGSEYRLVKVLRDPAYAKALVKEHVKGLQNAARAIPATPYD